jgi:hypothetical protein
VGPASKPVAETAQLARACKAVAFFFTANNIILN